MNWNEAYPPTREPSAAEIAAFVASPLWGELCGYLEQTYGVAPRVEHSGCGMAPGWNVKYKKGGKSICVLYPDRGQFTALVVTPEKEAPRAELVAELCSPYAQALFAATKYYMGGKWLMLEVTDETRLEDVKRLLPLRPVKPIK